MKYLSKGQLHHQNGGLITVAQYGQLQTIAGEDAKTWLAGYKSVQSSTMDTLYNLQGRGLVSSTEKIENPTIEAYRILTQCILIPKKRIAIGRKTSVEREVLTWLRFAGLHLTIAELVQLRSNEVMPVANLLGEENRQALVEKIYTTSTIPDLILEAQMEGNAQMPEILDGVLHLIEKGAVMVC